MFDGVFGMHQGVCLGVCVVLELDVLSLDFVY